MDWVNAVLQGILLGCLYALFAAWLSLIFGVMRLVNIAHGDLIILSAFIGDIIESYFKRKNNMKNSSQLITGHVGFFDRFPKGNRISVFNP